MLRKISTTVTISILVSIIILLATSWFIQHTIFQDACFGLACTSVPGTSYGFPLSVATLYQDSSNYNIIYKNIFVDFILFFLISSVICMFVYIFKGGASWLKQAAAIIIACIVLSAPLDMGTSVLKIKNESHSSRCFSELMSSTRGEADGTCYKYGYPFTVKERIEGIGWSGDLSFPGEGSQALLDNFIFFFIISNVSLLSMWQVFLRRKSK